MSQLGLCLGVCVCVCDCVEQTFELKVLNLNRAQLTRFSTQLGAACASFVCWPEKEERESPLDDNCTKEGKSGPASIEATFQKWNCICSA